MRSGPKFIGCKKKSSIMIIYISSDISFQRYAFWENEHLWIRPNDVDKSGSLQVSAATLLFRCVMWFSFHECSSKCIFSGIFHKIFENKSQNRLWYDFEISCDSTYKCVLLDQSRYHNGVHDAPGAIVA